jgi:translation elongation factor EF-1alpha
MPKNTVHSSYFAATNINAFVLSDNIMHYRSMNDISDKFEPPERAIDKPLRMCITDVFKGMGAGFSVSGTLQAGSVQVGEKVLIMPQMESANVKSELEFN